MTTTRVPATVSVQVAAICSAARMLAAGTRYDEALALLDATTDPDETTARLALLMARAEVTARREYVRGGGTDTGRHPLDDALALAAEAPPGAATAWELAMLRLRRDYAQQLFGRDGTPWFGPEGRDPAVPRRLTAEAARLRETAPGPVCRAWALMCLGWISDNLAGDRVAAPAYYAEALDLGRAAADPMLVFEAQRHLGDHAHDDGDHALALVAWQESTDAAARAGHLSGVLAQQLLLAVLARDAGDEAGATMLAGEVRRWASAVGAVQVARQAAGFLAGVDPTRPPEADGR